MKTITGHLTATNKKAIAAILQAGLTSGKVGRISYFIERGNDHYTVKIRQNDRGLIPCAGSSLRERTHSATFAL